MKSHLDYVLAVYESILVDASHTWPTLTSSFEKDLSYLRRAAENRGLRYFTVTLPELGKKFDSFLSREALASDWVPQGIPKRWNRPVLFQGLFGLVISDSDTLLPDFDFGAVKYLRQLMYCCKKYRIDCGENLKKEAVAAFFEIEDSMPPILEGHWNSETPNWRYDPNVHPLRQQVGRDIDSGKEDVKWDYGVWYLWQKADNETVGVTRDVNGVAGNHTWAWLEFAKICRIISTDLGEPDWYSLEGRHGPGVVSDQKGSYISKYEFPSWPARLGNWFPYEWFGSGILDSEHSYQTNEPMSRLIAVPKTQKGPRLICCEPICHQWMQQGIWRWLKDAVSRSLLSETITFGSQEISRERALKGSLDGSLATIDLSEASDRIHADLVGYVFNGNPLLDGIHACRTRYVMQTIDDNQRKGCCFRKFAPMGSALTFPIESIVFSAIAIWADHISRNISHISTRSVRSSARRVTVFGDDIIVPVAAVGPLLDILEDLGLKVNTNKSFWNGKFRESCGVDALMGVDVTPAYLLGLYDGSATSMSSIVECSNNFHKHGLWRSAQTIAAQLPQKELKLLSIVGGEVEGLGLFSFCGHTQEHLKVCWNVDYQREDSIALSVVSKTTKARGRGSSSLTQYFIERPSEQDPLTRVSWEAGQVKTVSHRKVRQRVPR